MTCQQKGCTKEAKYTIYWPNQVTQQCEECTKKVQGLGKIMGINVPIIQLRKNECTCVVKNREPNETQREWFKRWMCMFHWMQTDYYQNKIEKQNKKLTAKDFRHPTGFGT